MTANDSERDIRTVSYWAKATSQASPFSPTGYFSHVVPALPTTGSDEGKSSRHFST